MYHYFDDAIEYTVIMNNKSICVFMLLEIMIDNVGVGLGVDYLRYVNDLITGCICLIYM